MSNIFLNTKYKLNSKLYSWGIQLYLFLGRHLPLQNKVVFCNAFGSGMGDDPKYIALELLKRNNKAKLIWMLNDMSIPLVDGITPVLYGSVKAKWHLYTAKIWVYNYKNSFKVDKKRKGQYYIQCWHGSFATKKVEKDTEATLTEEYLRMTKADSKMIDLMYSNNDFKVNLFRTKFWYRGLVIKSDSPQLSVLVNPPKGLKEKVCSFFHLQQTDKIALYAPTFRKDFNVEIYKWNYRKALDALEKRFGGDFVLLLRLHPNVAHLCPNLDYSEKVISATTYPDMDELMAASDIMISDFSGVIFDMGICKKPVFLFAKDYIQYIHNDREQYIQASELPFTMAVEEEQLVNNINEFCQCNYEEKLNDFYNRIGMVEHGHGAENIANIIEQKLKS